MTKVFISYRREDSESEARNIQQGLASLGLQDIFFDRDRLNPGDKWPESIRQALSDASVVLAVIGPAWLTCQDEAGRRRIDNRDDWVRLELRTALENDKRIIPIIVKGATVPKTEALPSDLRLLFAHQALFLHSDSWSSDIERLSRLINAPPRKKPLILITSKSPRRKELLSQVGWVVGEDYFTTQASVSLKQFRKRQLSLEGAKKFAERTAQAKIDYVVGRMIEVWGEIGREVNLSDTIIVGIDTIVYCGDCQERILDRPLMRALEAAGPRDIARARARAKEMLLEQQGKTIHIITAMVIAQANAPNESSVKTVVTEAKMRDYSEEDIDDYITHAEPIEKAGAFGIQEKGVSLFQGINGSYQNIVGLPLREFFALLEENFAETFALPPRSSTLGSNKNEDLLAPALSAVCMGDINYDYIYDELPEDFFSTLRAPGSKVSGIIERRAGGTGVNFAHGAQMAGFTNSYVIGMVGGDALGSEITRELEGLGIQPLLPAEPSQRTSIAIIFRNTAKEDTAITITDARQSLPDLVVKLARETIETSTVTYCSGYCLMDPNRRVNARKLLRIAKAANRIVVLDVVGGMDEEISYEELLYQLQTDERVPVVSVIVSEFPEMFRWLDIKYENVGELEAWEENREEVIATLRKDFPVVILRTSNYSHEVVITPDRVIGPFDIPYATLSPREKVGYGDRRTAELIYGFLAPRIVLASKSPQRLQLLRQIVNSEKVVVRKSHCNEDARSESPHDRVKRLAREKAESVFNGKAFEDSIEFVIGADTEIIAWNNSRNQWELIGHPESPVAAEEDLLHIGGRKHKAITGIAVVGKDPNDDALKVVVDCVETEVTIAKMSRREARAYAASGEPLDRAGAYAIQGLGVMFVEKIEGSYSNVVGLPLERLSQILANDFEKSIWVFNEVSSWQIPESIKHYKLP